MKLFQYDKDDVKKTLDMAWPAILESFFAAFAGLVDSLMVSSMGSYAVAAVGLTTQPKFVGLSLFIAPMFPYPRWWPGERDRGNGRRQIRYLQLSLCSSL